MKRLSGRVAVVTGAASGIGRALAARFAAEGMRCVLADIEEDALARAVSELRAAGAAVTGVRTDVARAADVAACSVTLTGPVTSRSAASISLIKHSTSGRPPTSR